MNLNGITLNPDHFDIYVSDSTGYHIDFVEEHIEDAYNKIKSLFNGL